MTSRPKIAALATICHKHSHAQHFVDRFLEGYGWHGSHHKPPMDLVSLYVDQVEKNDLSRRQSQEFPSMKIYPTVAEALTCGGDELAVDGVMIICEHGAYEQNDKGQTLYPRYEFFKETVKVFESSGRTVPVFNDKHLSWNWEWAKEMVDTAREMGFSLMSGSCLPVCYRIPSVELPIGAEVEEALCIGYGGPDSYDFHGLETIQCMVERRAGFETGVNWLQAYKGEAFWKAHHDGLWSKELFNTALCRSHTLIPARSGFNNIFPTIDELKQLVPDPIAYHYEHNDGLKCTMMMMNGLVSDFNFAASLKGQSDPFSTQCYLQMPPERATLANFFSPLVNNIEKMFLTGDPTYPVERTLLTTGLTAAGVDSIHQELKRIDTPHLAITYEPSEESTFWRG